MAGVHAQGQLDLWHNKAVTQSVGGTQGREFYLRSARKFGFVAVFRRRFGCLLVKSKERRDRIQFSFLLPKKERDDSPRRGSVDKPIVFPNLISYRETFS